MIISSRLIPVLATVQRVCGRTIIRPPASGESLVVNHGFRRHLRNCLSTGDALRPTTTIRTPWMAWCMPLNRVLETVWLAATCQTSSALPPHCERFVKETNIPIHISM
ncbi:hypothetical protein C8Q79DRAFT_123652 [Trametes meyenii]|nr:hypothetical protein C8Q79DRAFT_123652 [Trametes meyenii]